jgi:choline kinase
MMKLNSPEVVVIIAAGMGSRLKDEDTPKPLRELGGKPMIIQVIQRFASAGIKDAIIVTGYRAPELKKGILDYNSDINLQFVHNHEYRKSNGLSVLAARHTVGDRNFYLSMADHIFDGSLIEGLATAAIPPKGLILAVDRKLDQIYDEDDATKVLTLDNKIVEINKNLNKFDAVDTGLFACTPELFVQIEKARTQSKDSDCSLSDGVLALSKSGCAAVHDIGDGRWQDVDTPGAFEEARRVFF